MKPSTIAAGVAVLFLLWSASVTAEPTSLERLVTDSDLVVLGTVKSLETADGQVIARFAVSETLKGSTPSKLFFLAPPLWSSPEFSRQRGRRLLLFLDRPQPSSNPGPLPATQLRGQPVFTIQWSGRARFTLNDLDGVDYVTIWSDELDLPADVPTLTTSFLPSFIERVPLRPLVKAIRRLLAEK